MNKALAINLAIDAALVVLIYLGGYQKMEFAEGAMLFLFWLQIVLLALNVVSGKMSEEIISKYREKTPRHKAYNQLSVVVESAVLFGLGYSITSITYVVLSFLYIGRQELEA